MLFGPMSGALGLFFRSKLYRLLVKEAGRNVYFGRNVVLRHPDKIHIGKNVFIDDNCVLDAKGDNPKKGLWLGDNVIISRNTVLSCQSGTIRVGDNTNIGMNCIIHCVDKEVRIGRNTVIGAFCYIIGAGGHGTDRVDTPMIGQPAVTKGIIIGDNLWIGAGVKVMDGVRIGNDAILGAASLVNKDVPDFAVVAGIPAKVIKKRI